MRALGRVAVTAALCSSLLWAAPGARAADAASSYDLFAVVNADGTLARGTPGTSVSHLLGSGLYDVHFAKSVAGCAEAANLGYPGDHEEFTFVAAITTGLGSDSHTVAVDVTYPGDIPGPGRYPHEPVLEDNSFDLRVDCNRELFALVSADGSVYRSSPGVSSVHLGIGSYLLNFGEDIHACAPVASVHNPSDRRARATQAYLALGSDPDTIQVSINSSATIPQDAAYAVIVTCTESPTALFPSSNGFYNQATMPNAGDCALTASWINTSAGGVPSDQGYVSTWSSDQNTGGVQTKNGGYGIAIGFGVDLVATC